ncbi:hypothetical protein V1477_005826 [Vespula maculifrons]|uniref:Uncharacterized protein n=1 Tax=Vespula maculifrons TaxID=7453 RepID=A0ABD2CP28_VESMC
MRIVKKKKKKEINKRFNDHSFPLRTDNDVWKIIDNDERYNYSNYFNGFISDRNKCCDTDLTRTGPKRGRSSNQNHPLYRR